MTTTPVFVAPMVRNLPDPTQPSLLFRDAMSAMLRLSRVRGSAEHEALGALFEEESTSDERRLIILDLLAHAGTPEAQMILRRVLSLAVARRNKRTFASFVQRLGFIERPDLATVRYLFTIYSESRGEPQDIRAACSYALGAAAGRAQSQGLMEAATFVSELLRRELSTAFEANEKCALITALGNIGLESDVSAITQHAIDSDPRVRGAAALALRKMPSRVARTTLFSLVGGANIVVAESAISALFGQPLEVDELVRLAELVADGRTAISLDSKVLRLFMNQRLGMHENMTADAAVIIERAMHTLLGRLEHEMSISLNPSPQESPTHEKKSGEYLRAESPLAQGTMMSVKPEAKAALLKTMFEPKIAVRMKEIASTSPASLTLAGAPSAAPGADASKMVESVAKPETPKAEAPKPEAPKPEAPKPEAAKRILAATMLQGGSDAMRTFRENAAAALRKNDALSTPKRALAQTVVQRDEIRSRAAASINVPVVELAVRKIRRSS